MQIELQLTKIGAVERISLKAHGLRSVANSYAYAFFRVFPCHSVANSSASPTVAYASGSVFRVFPCHSVAKMSFLLLLFSGSASFFCAHTNKKTSPEGWARLA